MQDHLLIADIHPPHLLRGEQQVGFSGKEDENTRLLECFPRELLSVQPGMKPQGGHQKLLTYFFLQSNVKMQHLSPHGKQCCEHGWIFVPQLNLAKTTISHGRGRVWTHSGQYISGVTKLPAKLSNKFCACYLREEEKINFKNLSKRFYLIYSCFHQKDHFFLAYFFKVSTIWSKE